MMILNYIEETFISPTVPLDTFGISKNTLLFDRQLFRNDKVAQLYIDLINDEMTYLKIMKNAFGENYERLDCETQLSLTIRKRLLFDFLKSRVKMREKRYIDDHMKEVKQFYKTMCDVLGLIN
jgi:hypothetical protein